MAIIPTTRRIDWYGNVGVPGGIPARTTIHATLSAGATAAQITSAIAACTSGQTVKLNAGTYNLGSGTINFASESGVTLRGAGQGLTILNFTGAGDGCIINDQYGFTGAAAISSGYTKGSTAVVMTGTPNAGITAGNLIMIDQDDDTSFIFSSDGPGRNMKFCHRVTSVAGNTVNFTPALPYAFTAGKNPKLSYLSGGPGLSQSGVEDLTINDGGRDNVVVWWNCDRCWVKNVEVTGAGQAAFFMVDSLQAEIRHCYAHDVRDFPGSNADGYGIYFYGSSGGTSSFCLAEDNIFDKQFVAMWQTASSCNAYLYNYCRYGHQGGFDHQCGIMNAGHGAHPMMCLWEGNIGEQWQHDGYHGSASHQTVFRNWIHGLHPVDDDNRKMIDCTRGSYYFNVVGNVLGDPSWSGPGTFQYSMTGDGPGYDERSVIYRLGYPNMANNDYAQGNAWPAGYGLSYPDAQTAATLARHGNYDYFSDAQVWETTDTNVTDHTDHAIPDSLYYPAKPAYFGTCPWPPFSPTAPGSAAVANIPAGYRYLNDFEDPPSEESATITVTTLVVSSLVIG